MGASQIKHKHNECNLICDLNPTLNNNYYTSLEEEDDITVVASNKSKDVGTTENTAQHADTDDVEPANEHTSRGTMSNGQQTRSPIFPTRQKAWTTKVELEGLKDGINAETMFNTSSIKIAVDQAIADAGVGGCEAHFEIFCAHIWPKPFGIIIRITQTKNLAKKKIKKNGLGNALHVPFFERLVTEI